MTCETNGGGKGFAYERSDGTIAMLRESVHAHFIADLSSLEVLADNREVRSAWTVSFWPLSHSPLSCDAGIKAKSSEGRSRAEV
jgi:hypothetical protein